MKTVKLYFLPRRVQSCPVMSPLSISAPCFLPSSQLPFRQSPFRDQPTPLDKHGSPFSVHFARELTCSTSLHHPSPLRVVVVDVKQGRPKRRPPGLVNGRFICCAVADSDLTQSKRAHCLTSVYYHTFFIPSKRRLNFKSYLSKSSTNPVSESIELQTTPKSKAIPDPETFTSSVLFWR